MRTKVGPLACLAISIPAGLLAAGGDFPSYASVKPLLPASLQNIDEAKWRAWCRREDQSIRARLAQGDLDSMANLLLLGTSFTHQPRIRMEALTEASKSGVLRSRVDDLVAGLANPGDNERLVFLQRLLSSRGIDPGESGKFLYENLLRVLKERKALVERAASAQGAARSSLFHDRGLSSDTSIFPAFSVDQTLADLKQRGLLNEGRVARVGVIGPGLDFIDKNEDSAFDYYPEQTLQPFALYDSLLRLGLAKDGAISLSIFDISSPVLEHIRRARERAAKDSGYVIQLPREATQPWPPELTAYWKSLGDRVGSPVAPIRPPEIFPGLETRAVSIRPELVRACDPVDLNIVVERLNLPASNRFDLIVATNIFVYYDAFQQALGLANVGAMLKPGGFLLTNDHLPEVPGMRLAGGTAVLHDVPEGVNWYRKE
jgi:hypothetical protein